MSNLNSSRFQVFIEGVQTGNIGRWKHAPLMVTSHWSEGSDDEKFEVLSAIRKTYNCDSSGDIRGTDHLGPSQIGRNEGFTELSYRRANSLSLQVTIIPTVIPYRRMVPQPRFNMIDWLRRSGRQRSVGE